MFGFGNLGQFALGEGPNGVNSGQIVTGQFNSFTLPLAKKGLAAAIIATTFVGFVAPPQAQATPVFTKFSQPEVRKLSVAAHARWGNLPQRTIQIFTTFSSFSQPFNSRGLIADEMPSALFEVAPPTSPPFSGFANFSNAWRAKARPSALFEGFKSFQQFIPPPDTHDLVFMADERKRKKKRDLFDEEKRRKERLRSDLELAIYGPPVVYTLPDWTPPPALPQAPDVHDLAQIMIQAKAAQKAQQELEDEQDIEHLLKDLL